MYAHKVEIAEDVGATLHIEPNDNPKAGEPTRMWFALTQLGGTVIPLDQCRCQLQIYQNNQVILTPSLSPWSAEGYKNIPSAIATFPKVGQYNLEISGQPQNGADFQPFKLNFAITVATARSTPAVVQPTEQPVVQPIQIIDFSYVAIALVVMAVVWLGLRARK